MKFDHIQQFFFFSVLIFTTAIFFWMLGSYLLPVFWALVIAIVFYPLYLRFDRMSRGRSSLAAIAAIGAVIVTVMLPLVVVGGMVAQESLALYQSINNNNSEQFDGMSMLDRAEKFIAYLEPYGISKEAVVERLRDWAAGVSQVIGSSLVTFGQVTFSLFISTAVMLYLLFFLFRDAEGLQKILIHYLPMGNTYEKRLFTRFAETSRAVVKGTLAIALLQGFLGGMAFWIVGVSNPVLWGVAMAILSIVPAVGPAIIWFPASVILLATGSIWEGVTLIVVGVLLVSLVDEFVRPILVGRGSKMPDSVTLLATIGGLATFGISGFVVGPIIAAFFLSLWVMFGEHYEKELSKN